MFLNFFLLFDSAKEAKNEVTTFLNLKFITAQKTSFEKILQVNELQAKEVLLNVADTLQKIAVSRT